MSAQMSAHPSAVSMTIADKTSFLSDVLRPTDAGSPHSRHAQITIDVQSMKKKALMKHLSLMSFEGLVIRHQGLMLCRAGNL